MTAPLSDADQTEAAVLTADAVRAAEAALVSSGIDEWSLMQRAAEGCTEWIWRLAAGRGVTVLCGPGRNGGDGYLVAERLRRRGVAVEVVSPIPPRDALAVRARHLFNGSVVGAAEATAPLLIDALFGTGLARPPEGEARAELMTLYARHPLRVAIDVPSMIAADTGAVLLDGLPGATHTLALGAWKPAHWLMPARARMGMTRLIPIGLQAASPDRVAPRPRLAAPPAEAHKYTRGLVAVLGGAMPGAAILACESAARAGAGYVKLLTRSRPEGVPPHIVTAAIADAEDGLDPRTQVVVAGPGLGRDSGARELLDRVLASTVRLVLDADALLLLRVDDRDRLGVRAVLTPHAGELAALCDVFGVPAGERLCRVRALAGTLGCCVVAKGPDTLVAAPDGVRFFPPAPSWLATAGSGDVLAGIVAGRAAAGGSLPEAAVEAVWLHGEAARLCGLAFTASQLAHGISAAWRAFT
ncbi:NAD(P)H-hydrate dehydratase [Erythrobacteraceae bacterium CFH 75059]|uniref:NAD(P)H-hydrate dehydratase n=1 Tax=Qipengyuania thermophila TaxID=2509361 RepID=UPI00101FEBDA|nr:NAD(P)H-hydrate dehydratase [Qipengyuania thermophila]TCD05322.1 NAD(P)H-hydrate dehydratase [Erythrobacteraceae bacterium CFH 75059]